MLACNSMKTKERIEITIHVSLFRPLLVILNVYIYNRNNNDMRGRPAEFPS